MAFLHVLVVSTDYSMSWLRDAGSVTRLWARVGQNTARASQAELASCKTLANRVVSGLAGRTALYLRARALQAVLSTSL